MESLRFGEGRHVEHSNACLTHHETVKPRNHEGHEAHEALTNESTRRQSDEEDRLKAKRRAVLGGEAEWDCTKKFVHQEILRAFFVFFVFSWLTM